MAKCYWAYEDGQKFWIPGCHLALYQDCGPCHCREWEKEQAKLRPPSEEKEYKSMNRHLLEENERLIKVIDELKSKLCTPKVLRRRKEINEVVLTDQI